jgi:uncharacterized protein HemY
MSTKKMKINYTLRETTQYQIYFNHHSICVILHLYLVIIVYFFVILVKIRRILNLDKAKIKYDSDG